MPTASGLADQVVKTSEVVEDREARCVDNGAGADPAIYGSVFGTHQYSIFDPLGHHGCDKCRAGL